MQLERPEDTWKKLWQKARSEDYEEWDYQSELIHHLLIRELNNIEDRSCLESGSGTGRVSFKLAEKGANVILLDTSKAAIRLSRITKKGNSNFVLGSILRLPFRASILDIVWNAGVLEHFRIDEQQTAILESLRVLKKEGKLIVIIPNRKAYFYNLFRILRIKKKTWSFGYEEPMSCKDFKKFSPNPKGFLSCGFLWQFTFCNIPLFSSTFIKIIKKLLRIPIFEKIDKVCEGYLLMAIFLK